MRRVWLIGSLVAMACLRAEARTPEWSFTAGAGTCTMRQTLEGNSRKPQVDVSISWHRVMGQAAHVTVPAVFSRDATVRIQSHGNRRTWSRSANGNAPVVQGAAVDVLRRNLLRGLPIEVTFEGGGIRPLTYSTSAAGAIEASAAFDACVRDERLRVAIDDRVVGWKSDVSLRGSCSLTQRFPDVSGLVLAFHDAAPAGVSFEAVPSEQYFPGGGVMNIHLQGRAAPWQLEAVISRTPSSEAEVLLDELRQGRRPRLVFEPRGAKPVDLGWVEEGLVTSVAMFDACRAAHAKPRPGIAPLNVLQYSVAGTAGQCQFSASYQVEAAVIWVVAVADAQGRRINVTKRAKQAGNRIQYLDLRSLGEPEPIDSDDAIIVLDATSFASLMSGLMGEGLEISFHETPSRRYRARYGGPQAISEAAMFDACVRAKYASQP